MKLLVEARPEGPTLAAMTADVERMMKEMGLREADFSNLCAEVKFPQDSKPQAPCQVINFSGTYRPILTDATPDNVCRLSIRLERFGDFWFGKFGISDPLKGHQAIACSKKVLAYSTFTRVVSKACQIGCLPSESRATWHRRAGWSNLLPEVTWEV
ncbi:MAG TPA: hypothetical protein P5080_02935 [Candidatus Paceibacterota bacterium]|nr:hypothetical protein [Candidatus Pacearchaeota archaeon]HRZ50923.1 hypothetical protein [Candidatus Paceibacterota bacterium]HSA36644.1 hypothetical protein [Candidatus Paceibacterota bacterium]